MRIDWRAAQGELRTADILLCRASGIEGHVIEHATRSQFVHAAMAGWCYDRRGRYRRLMLAETIQQHPAHVLDLESEVAKWPGLYDVFRVKDECWYGVDGPDRAWDFMLQAAGNCYGWNYILRAWLRRRLGKWLVPPITNSESPDTNRDCSGLVHAALRYGDGPQVQVYDCDVAPGDLPDERYTRYIGTLVYTQ